MDSQELMERSAEERRKIFERYEMGRQEGAQIDPWEDPEYNVYSNTDHYGFIHDQKLPSPDDKKTLEKRLQVLAQREKKWVKMLSKWDSKSTKEKLQKRIYKGIPDKVRTQVWQKLLNLNEVINDKENKNKYSEMLKLARLHSTEVRQIDSDVNRQFRENIMFRERYSPRQRSLFNVLVAYSIFNAEVSYCQGMSTLAGMLLMYLEEEETFWALNILLTDRKYAMHGLFILGFPKLTRFLSHHDKILAKFLPKLKRHFDQCNLDSILYSLKWFFVIFVERIPFSLCLRVWDIYLLEGEKVSTAMAYTVLKLHKNKLMKFKDLDSIVHFLQVKLPKDFGYDDDYVIKALEQCSEELRKAKMELPPPAEANELPQRPFGVFVEPTKDEKIGHRKSDFTEIEKEVTENVIKTREQTAADLEKEPQITAADVGLGGSNSQLNTEDGGSLNLSKRSLADTSVTSTADLSIFSGGDRRPASQQHQIYELENSLIASEKLNCSDIDLHNIVGEDEENGESSPNSMAKSSSTIQICQKAESVKAEISPLPSTTSSKNVKTNNTNNNSSETPTPTISQNDAVNSDVIKIYVPPAEHMLISTDKMLSYQRDRDRADDEMSQCSNRSSIVHVEYETLPFDKSPEHTAISISQKQFTMSVHEQPISAVDHKVSPSKSLHHHQTSPGAKSQPQHFYYYPHQSASSNVTNQQNFQSSSSRRGSMTRKTPSPMIDSDLIIECDHMRFKRSQENLHNDDDQYSINYSINGSTTSSNKYYQFNTSNNNHQHNNNNNNVSPIKRLTSFEELAKKSESNSLLYISESINDNNYRHYSSSNSKPKSDYNICYNYKNLDQSHEEIDYPSIKHHLSIKKSTSHTYNLRRSDRKHSSSDNSPFDYDLLKEKRKENRFMYDDDDDVSNGRHMENHDNSIKSYDRFFNSDDEIEEEYEMRHSRVNKKSSSSNAHKYRSHVSGTEADADDDENSSNSPNNKSISNTPINECIPLLSCDAEQTVIYQSPIPPAPIMPISSTSLNSSFRQQQKSSRIPLRIGNNNYNNSNSGSNKSPTKKNSSISSPESDKSINDGLQKSKSKSQRSDNKIRIKIKQNN